MPLTDEQESLEHDLRVQQMTVNVEKLRNDIRLESRKIVAQFIGAIATAFAAGAAVLGLILHLTGKI